jgi:hypothetical protein
MRRNSELFNAGNQRAQRHLAAHVDGTSSAVPASAERKSHAVAYFECREEVAALTCMKECLAMRAFNKAKAARVE